MAGKKGRPWNGGDEEEKDSKSLTGVRGAEDEGRQWSIGAGTAEVARRNRSIQKSRATARVTWGPR